MKITHSKEFDFKKIEREVAAKWDRSPSNRSRPDERSRRFTVMMPLPNVTGALHMGHAINNVLQDLFTRWHRMKGYNTLWMPGTDHAGIATQAVIEKRIFELEGKTRHDIGKEALIRKIWAWKDDYEARIIQQQKRMGCSCDWSLHRFTMDPVCTRAVRSAFFTLFKDGLIYRGYRLVNWDCHLETAISDDEIIRETTDGHFWHIRYPFIDPHPGEPSRMVIATTRPETMLGDTAVAVHPEPGIRIEALIRKKEERLASTPEKDRESLKKEIKRLRKRKKHLLPRLKQLVDMARDGRRLRLPLINRNIPLILDEWAQPEKGSGGVKITPAHDPNDYEVWLRHRDRIGIVNLLNPDGTYNENAGRYAGKDRMDIRRSVIRDLEQEGLLEEIEKHQIELGLSDRSKTPVEPYLSKQWFIRMDDVPGGITCGKDTGHPFHAPGLAQTGLNAVNNDWSSHSGRRLKFFPDAQRYKKTYQNWLSEKRDWCISRQLWWGHRIPIWHGRPSAKDRDLLKEVHAHPGGAVWYLDHQGRMYGSPEELPASDPPGALVCLGSPKAENTFGSRLKEAGLWQDPDVLDTWFSSALWPFSTLGWPDPETAPVGPGHQPLKGREDAPNFLDYYYPGSCLITARDIITLWVVRMTIFGLYFLGDIPFTDCFINATIQDGKGERMSKSKGNGIDPIDIIDEFGADALRYVLCDMQTGNQDIKLPVQAISPFTGKAVDLTDARHGRSVFTYMDPEVNREFDVLGSIPSLPRARITSDRFQLGKSFCIKLWNATRFALLNLEDYHYAPCSREDLREEDLWILSRLHDTIRSVNNTLDRYNPSAALGLAREFFWTQFCDWYLEIIKPRIRRDSDKHVVQSVLTLVIDRVLRIFHPFVPYITEALWELLGELAPNRGLLDPIKTEEDLISASWPRVSRRWIDPERDTQFSVLQNLVRTMRNQKNQYQVPPAQKVKTILQVPPGMESSVDPLIPLIESLAAVIILDRDPGTTAPPPLSAVSIVERVEIYMLNLLNPEKEIRKLEKKKATLEKLVQGSRKRLENPHFIEKAPADVVEGERRKCREFQQQLEGITENLKKFAVQR